jgi:hypothetical protein
MKTKSFFYYLILIFIGFSSYCFSQEKFSYGVKGGIGLWRFMSLETIPEVGEYPHYSYPIGFSTGLFFENELTKNFSLVNELLYQNSSEKVTIYTGVEGVLDQKVTTQSVSLSILLKYKTPWLWQTYIVLGPSFAYLIKANYNFVDEIYAIHGDVDITNNFPVLNTSIEFGLGKKLQISNLDLMVEIRGQLGITKFQHHHGALDYYDIGKWRNSGLIFFIGLQL